MASQAKKGGSVSIIMPAYNAEPWIQDAIDSVIAQTHENWELIVVIDGSEDRTESIVRSYGDERVRCIVRMENRGVSSARNRGLEEMNGDFFLFFDSDDLLFPRSLESRINLFFRDPELAFVDGGVRISGVSTDDVLAYWVPSFEGPPKKELLALKDSCFVTITWLIRADALNGARFDEELTHCEDLDLFLRISDQGKYGYVDEPVMTFRRTGRSAMSDLKGLENGYRRLVRKWQKIALDKGVDMKARAKRVLFRSYLKKGAFFAAVRSRFAWDTE